MSELLAYLSSFLSPANFILVVWVLVELRRIERELYYLRGLINGVRRRSGFG